MKVMLLSPQLKQINEESYNHQTHNNSSQIVKDSPPKLSINDLKHLESASRSQFDPKSNSNKQIFSATRTNIDIPDEMPVEKSPAENTKNLTLPIQDSCQLSQDDVSPLKDINQQKDAEPQISIRDQCSLQQVRPSTQRPQKSDCNIDNKSRASQCTSESAQLREQLPKARSLQEILFEH